MPIYTCTTTASTLNAQVKAALAGEIGRIHSSINHVPSTYVNVVFHELPADGVYTDGVPANPVLVSGWVRAGHPEAETTRLATEIADAVYPDRRRRRRSGACGDAKQPSAVRGRRWPCPA